MHGAGYISLQTAIPVKSMRFRIYFLKYTLLCRAKIHQYALIVSFNSYWQVDQTLLQ